MPKYINVKLTEDETRLLQGLLTEYLGRIKYDLTRARDADQHRAKNEAEYGFGKRLKVKLQAD